jgi:predicted small lipoprotein YifL
MTMTRLLLAAMLLSTALTACGVRGDPKPLDAPSVEKSQ